MLGYLFALMLSAQVFAGEALPAAGNVQLPADLNKLNFYLITVDTGNHVWDNFGHTALRVIDENSNTDTVFNWGLFDTSGGLLSFSFNFFKGIMNYQLGTFAPESEFANYRLQQRTVWQERINLNNQQKAILYNRLMWNIRPENIVYPYQYFFDNCTTRVRDYLDEALNGKISASTSELTSNTFRDLVRYHYRSLATISVSLDVLMNSNIDRQVTAWEDMFLPLSLRARLMHIESDVAIAGNRMPLLTDPTVIMEYPAVTESVEGYFVAGTTLLLPVILLFLLLRRERTSFSNSSSGFGLRMPGFSLRVLGIMGILTSLLSGVYGCLMLGGWFFSGHADLYNNWNLLLFWPTDLLGILVGGRWLLLAKPWALTQNSTPFIHYYLLLRLLSLVIYAGVAGTGLAEQALMNLLIYVAPGLFFYTVLIWLVGFKLGKSKYTLY